MIQELLYTSAPKGLKAGSRGFCTVLSTQGMSAPLATALEGLSGYRPLFSPTDPRHKDNPVVHSHLTFAVAGRRVNVLSRIADYGLDYTQRTNKLAHYVVVDPENQPAAGPAWLLARSDFMRTSWEGEPRVIPVRQSAPSGDVPAGVCTNWQQATGDAGWAGVLAETFLADPKRMAFLICPIGLDPLPLIAEAIALLPRERRWEVTFSTYFTTVPQNANCAWRCLIEGTPEVHQSRRYVQALRLDLVRMQGQPTGGAPVEAARTGRKPTRPTSLPDPPRDAPPPLADDPRPPAGDGAYRLQRVREVDHPPLLEMESGRRRRKRGVPYLAISIGFLTLAVLVVGGALLLKSRQTTGTAIANNNTASLEKSEATDSSTAPSQSESDTETTANVEKDDPTADASDPVSNGSEIAGATEVEPTPGSEEPMPAPPDQTPQQQTSDETAANENNNTDPSLAGTSPGSTEGAQSTPDESGHPVPSNPDAWLGHIDLLTNPMGDDAPQKLLDEIALGPIDELQMRLFVPLTYAHTFDLAPTGTTAGLALRYRPPGAQEDFDLAKFYTESSGATDKLWFQWLMHHTHHNALRWCVLLLERTDASSNAAYALSKSIPSSPMPERALLVKHNLPSLVSAVREGGVAPELRFDSLIVNVANNRSSFERDPTFTPESRSPFDVAFHLKSSKSLGVKLKQVKMLQLTSEFLPSIRTRFNNGTQPTIEFVLHEFDSTPLWNIFESECSKVFEKAKGESGLTEVPDTAKPNTSLLRRSTGDVDQARMNWKSAYVTAMEAIKKKKEPERGDQLAKLENLDTVVVGCCDDASALWGFVNGLKQVTIQSVRVYYIVKDISGLDADPREISVHILRIDPLAESSDPVPEPGTASN